jgi:hypothetical protein
VSQNSSRRGSNSSRSTSVDVTTVCRRCTGRDHDRRPFRGRQVHTWSGGSRGLRLWCVVVAVCRRAVLFNVLAPGLIHVGVLVGLGFVGLADYFLGVLGLTVVV